MLRFRGALLGDPSIPDDEVVAAIEATMVVRCIYMFLMSAESELLLHVNVKKNRFDAERCVILELCSINFHMALCFSHTFDQRCAAQRKTGLLRVIRAEGEVQYVPREMCVTASIKMLCSASRRSLPGWRERWVLSLGGVTSGPL